MGSELAPKFQGEPSEYLKSKRPQFVSGDVQISLPAFIHSPLQGDGRPYTSEFSKILLRTDGEVHNLSSCFKSRYTKPE